MGDEGSSTPRGMTGTVVRGVGLAASGYAGFQAINLAVYLVLARLVTPEEFGQLAAGAVLVNAGLVFANSGMGAAVIQRRDRIEEAASTAVVATVLAGIGLGLGALALSPLVGHIFHSHQVTLVAAAASGWVVVRAFAIVPDALMQKRFSFARRVVVDPLGVVVFGAVAITAAAHGLGVWALVLGNYAQFATMSISSWVLARWRPRLRLASVAMWRELAGFGRHVLTSNGIAEASGFVQTGVIGRFLGTATLGQFEYGFRLVQVPLGAVVNAGSYVLFPAFSRISADAERFRGAYLRAVRLTCSLAVPVSFLLLPLGAPLAVLVFGDVWLQAGHLASAMFAFTAARAFNSVAREVFKASGRPDVLPRLQIVSTVATCGLIVAAVPIGATAVGAAISVASVAAAAYAIRAVSPIIGAPARRILEQAWPSVAASGVMVAAVYGLELVLDAEAHGTAAGLALLGAEGAVGIGLYLAALAAISPATVRELTDVTSHLRARLRSRRDRPAKPSSSHGGLKHERPRADSEAE
jgi:PST family polysaccharide transporter